MFAGWKIPLPSNFDYYRNSSERIQEYWAAQEWNIFFAEATQAFSLFPTKLPKESSMSNNFVKSNLSDLENAVYLLANARRQQLLGEHGKDHGGFPLLQTRAAENILRREFGHEACEFLMSCWLGSLETSPAEVPEWAFLFSPLPNVNAHEWAEARDETLLVAHYEEAIRHLSIMFPGRSLVSLPSGTLLKALISAANRLALKPSLEALGIEEGTRAGFKTLRRILQLAGRIPGKNRELSPYYYTANQPRGERKREAGAVAWVILEAFRKLNSQGSPLWALLDEEVFPAKSWCGNWPRTQDSIQAEEEGTENFWELAKAVAESGFFSGI